MSSEESFYVFQVGKDKQRILKNGENNYEFIDVTDIFDSGYLEIDFLDTNFKKVGNGDPNEGLSKNSRFYETPPKRVLRRPHHDKDKLVGKWMVEYATGKKENIKNIFGEDLDYNSVGIFSDNIPTDVVIAAPTFEDWMLALRCFNLIGKLEKLDEIGVKAYSLKDF